MKVIETIKRLLRNPEFAFGNTIEMRHRDQLEGEREAAYSEGHEEGAKQNSIETAKKLLPKMSMQEICEITNLSLEEIEKLNRTYEK